MMEKTLIGLISDTHGEVYMTRRVLSIFDSYGIDMILHCGDIGASVVAEFSDRATHFVCGNTDDQTMISSLIEPGKHTYHERFGEVNSQGRSIAFLHGDDQNLLRQTIVADRWDVVCHGHTHTADKSRCGRTLVINPGALCRTIRPSAAVLETPSLEVTFFDLA
jgi:uncharacterized protein